MTVKWQLVVDHGAHNGDVIPIDASVFWIGRSRTCRLRPTSESVSRRHCAVLVRDSGLFVVDCQTTNGTFVNGQRIDKHKLHDGDRLQIGPLVFKVRLTEPVPDQPSNGPKAFDEDGVAQMLLSMDGAPVDLPSQDDRLAASSPTDGIALGLNDTIHDQELIKANQANSVTAAEKLLAEYSRRPRA